MTDIDCHRARRSAFTLIELLCVIAIIAVLASLLAGASGRVLKRIRADEWGEKSSFQFGLVRDMLRKRFAGRDNFPTVTLELLEADGVLQPTQIRFLRDKRVAFVPFSGADPSNFVVVALRIERGFFTDAETRVLTKGEVVAPVP